MMGPFTLFITGIFLALIQAEVNRYTILPLNLGLIFLFLLTLNSSNNFSSWAFWFAAPLLIFEGQDALWLVLSMWLPLFIYEVFKKKITLGLLPLFGIWLLMVSLAFLPLGILFLKNLTLTIEGILLTFSLGGFLILILRFTPLD